jgi:hypothetical protein
MGGRACHADGNTNNFTHPTVPMGTDTMRRTQIPHLDFKLSYFKEVFTSKNWIIRIYRVLPDRVLDRVY